MIGEWKVRLFYDEEDYKGRSSLVRYAWSDVSPRSAHMEQAFSADGGKAGR